MGYPYNPLIPIINTTEILCVLSMLCFFNVFQFVPEKSGEFEGFPACKRVGIARYTVSLDCIYFSIFLRGNCFMVHHQWRHACLALAYTPWRYITITTNKLVCHFYFNCSASAAWKLRYCVTCSCSHSLVQFKTNPNYSLDPDLSSSSVDQSPFRTDDLSL